MIETPTVFILGAGASEPYRFPIGSDLRLQVIHGLLPNSGISNVLSDRGLFSKEEMEKFRLRLERAGGYSVDSFLSIDQNKEFLRIGKAAMAVILINCESENDFFQPSPQRWIRDVYAAMSAPLERLKDNKVSFVTFNYDRSLEHFLFESIRHGYGHPPDDFIREIMDSFNIIHLHGNLGWLPWQNHAGYRPYNPELSKEAIEMCIQSIKIVHEPIVDERDKEFSRARDLLKNAKRIYCLGFGYGAQNMQNLDFMSLPTSSVRGSGYGLTAHQCDQIAHATQNRVAVFQGTNCMEFLRSVAHLS